MRDVLILTGNVEGGIPPFQPPWHFGLNATEVSSPDLHEGPLDIAGHLGIGLAMMPLVANLQQLAIAKFYTRKLQIDNKSTNSQMGVHFSRREALRTLPMLYHTRDTG